MLKLILNLTKKASSHMQPEKKHLFYDIAANLTDSQFSGQYYGKKHHQDDRQQVVKRARDYGCEHLLIAAGNLEDAYHSHDLCQKYKNAYSTIGVHPCRAKQPFDSKKWQSVKQYFEHIQKAIQTIKPSLVAIGECGLDYDRLEWSTKQQQLQVFPHHFQLAQKYKLPMYLHNRNTGTDFFDIVRKNRDRFTTGVVHSFTGTKEQLDQILELNLYVGINGCSLKTQENLVVLKHVPFDRIMLETDSPYCEIRNSHKSSGYVKTKFQSKPKQKKKQGLLVKGRNEPCKIIEVLEVVSAVLQVAPEQLAQKAYENSMNILGLNKEQ